MCLQSWTQRPGQCQPHWLETGRTGIFLIFRIGRLKKDLDTVERRNDRLCLGRRKVDSSHVSRTSGASKKYCYTRHTQQHHQRCQSESLGPRILSWNHQSSFEFNAHTQVGRRCGGSLVSPEGTSDAPVRIGRHVIRGLFSHAYLSYIT
jgi:hypothetical protein